MNTLGRSTSGRVASFLVTLAALITCMLALSISAQAQTTIESLFPSRIAVGYEGVEGGLNINGTLSADPGFSEVTGTVGGAPIVSGFIEGTFFSILVNVNLVPATLGPKPIQLCDANAPTNCTSVAGSEVLQVVPAQVVYLDPQVITAGASDQDVYVEYLSPRASGPETDPEVRLRNAQGTETSLGPASFLGYDIEGFPGLHYLEITVPASFLAQPETYTLRIVETFANGSDIVQTDPTVDQERLQVVGPPQFVTQSPLPPLIVGQTPAQSPTIVATGGVPIDLEGPLVYNYFQVSGQVPTGMFLSGSFSAAATLSGTPTAAGIFTFEVEVSDRFDIATRKTYRIGVQTPTAPPLSFPGTTLSTGRVAESYFALVQATGGVGPYTYAINGRPLPPGLTLAPSGFISGVPTSVGTFTVDIQAEDNELRQVTSAFQIQVLPPFPPLIFLSTSPLPSVREGTPYTFQFQSTGGSPPYAYFLNEGSNLPPGLNLSQAGTLSGTPTAQGSYQFEVIVADSRSFGEGQNFATASKLFSLTILPPVPPPSFITSATLPAGEVGTAYSTVLETKDGIAPVRIIVPVGVLPPGLGFNETTRTISGTPTTVGEWGFLVTARDAQNQEGSRFFTIVVRDQIAPLTISTTSPLPEAGLNENYSTRIVASGGVEPYLFAVTQGALPAGLTLNAGSGLISGIPTQNGNFTFTVRVTDAAEGSTTREFTLRVLSTVRLITESPLPNGIVGQAYSQTIVAQGGIAPYVFSVIGGTLPSGVTLNADSGLLSGTPTAPFSGQFTVRVRDSSDPLAEATRVYQLRIRQPLELTVLELPLGTRGQPYSLQFGAQGGEPGYTFALVSGTLQNGLTLSPNGRLDGTPTEVGIRTIVVRVTDSEQSTAQRTYTLEVRAPQVNGGGLSLSSTVGVSNTQNEVDVTLSTAQADEITGVVTMSVTPNVNPPVDDPTIQFIGGGRTAAFVIPAGQTSARFGTAETARFQTGTTASTLVFTATFRRGGQDATPSPAPQASLGIPATPPSITSLSVTRANAALTVVIVGFSSERSITTAVLEFARRPGAPGDNPQRFDVNVAQAFQQWFASAASQPFGSQFKLTIPVTLSGDPADITGLTVRLIGPAGTGNSSNATF